tara:strand:+ start:506 stop:625 length:120 start_codon:yes stop_codon:yes gene_type:complete
MLTLENFKDAEIIRNRMFVCGAIRWGWIPPVFFNVICSS